MAELAEEDWQFIKRFLLASGSLKDLAAQYGVSYPTIRLRMDKLIEKIRVLDETRHRSTFHRKIQLLVVEGKLDVAVARTILNSYEKSRRQESGEGE